MKSSAVIREFQRDDVEVVCRVLEACSTSKWPQSIPSEHFVSVVLGSPEWVAAKAYVGVCDGRVRAFGAVVAEAEGSRIPYFHVHPQFRRRGLGGEMLQAIEMFLKSRDGGGVSVRGPALGTPFHGVDAEDPESASFFLHRGFVEQFRAATRVLKLSELRVQNDADFSRPHGYTFDVLSESCPTYWKARESIVGLCHQCEPLFLVFSNSYDGGLINKFNAHLAIAAHGEALVGFAGFVPEGNAGIGYEAAPQWGPFLVHPSHRGRGVGRELLVLSLREMTRLGCETVVLGGTGVDGPAVHLYESLGFKTVLTWVQFRKDLQEQIKS